MDESNPYQSSNAQPSLPDRGQSLIPRMPVVLLSTSAACGLAAAIGYWGAASIGSVAPSVLSMLLLPAAGAWIAKVRSPNQLLKIAAYGVVGWYLCNSVQPAVSGKFNGGHPDVNSRWAVIAFVPASLLAVVGAGFACREESKLTPGSDD